MKKIEAAPLDLTEEQATILWDWSYEIEAVIKRSAGIAIAMNVGRNTLLHGESRVSHKEYGRRCGVCRRSIDTAVKQLKQHDIIQRIGTTPAGIAIYRANFQWQQEPARDLA